MKRLIVRLTAVVSCAVALIALSAVAHAEAEQPGLPGGSSTCIHPVAYFDLGNVLVDSHDFTKMKYMPEAQRYVRRLKARQVTMGLIVNIPVKWGTSDQERVDKLKEFIASGWIGDTPFDWTPFEGRIILPRTDGERKPAPAMFERGLEWAAPCEAVYQGEDLEELDAAGRAGLRTYHVGQPDQPYFMPVRQL
ncbi:MAG: hypothetical protein H0T78_12795 [Longispora sp.]|nr:hypothetical protein [Longispora sp. (in: high G+C Gram-positive bacteria)]